MMTRNRSIADRLPRPSLFACISIALALAVVVGLIYPGAGMIGEAFFVNGKATLGVVTQAVHGYAFGLALRNSVIVAVVGTALAVPIGTLMAWFNERTDAQMGRLSAFLPVVPLVVPSVAMAIGWTFLGDPRSGFLTYTLHQDLHLPTGLLNIDSWQGLIFLYVLFLVPQIYIIVGARLRSVDPSLEEAARVIGKGPFWCLFRVSIPSILPSIGSAGLLSIFTAFELYSIPAVIGTPARVPVLSTYIFNLLNGRFPPQEGQAAVIGMGFIIVLLTLWFAQQRLQRKNRSATIGGKGIRGNVVTLGWSRYVVRTLMLLYVLVASVLPVAALIIVSLQKFWQPQISLSQLSLQNFLTSLEAPDISTAVINTVIVAGLGATVVVLIAVVLSVYATSRGGVIGVVIGLITKISAGIPALILALGMLIAVGAKWGLSGTIWILLITYVVSRLPSASIVVENGYGQIGRELIEASSVTGSPMGRTTRRIVLPLLLATMAAAWSIVFVTIVGDLNVVAILSGPGNPTMGYEIITTFDYGTYSTEAALGVVVSLGSAVIVGLGLGLAQARFRGRGGQDLSSLGAAEIEETPALLEGQVEDPVP